MEGRVVPPVWPSRDWIGEGEVLRGYGGVVCPLLAGFSLTAITGLLASAGDVPLRDYAIAAFGMATVSLMCAIQFAFAGVRRLVSPAERIAWFPEAASDEEALQDARWEDLLALELTSSLRARAQGCTNVGLLFFLVALVLMLVPTSWSIGRSVAFAIAALGGLLELAWILTAMPKWQGLPGIGPIRRVLSPDWPDVEARAEVLWEKYKEGAPLDSVLKGRRSPTSP